MISAAFIICWLPLTIVFLLMVVTEIIIPQETMIFCFLLSHANSAIDPIIYAIRITEVKEAMMRFIGRGRGETSQQNNSSEFELK